MDLFKKFNMAREVTEKSENVKVICVTGKKQNKIVTTELHNMKKNEETNESKNTDIVGEKPVEDGNVVEKDSLEEVVTENTEISVDSLDKGNRRGVNPRNTYAAKKTVAQGMMDVALITANANQLRYLIEYQSTTSTFYVNVALIVCSLLLQIAVGLSLIFKGRFDIRGESKCPGARRIDNYVVVGVFLTTIINVFVAAFSVSPPTVPYANVIPIDDKSSNSIN